MTRTPRPGMLPPAGLATGDGRGVEHLTPPQGVPVAVDDVELSTPIIVPLPTMSRTRTDSEPPRMTESEYRRHLTAERKRLEQADELLMARCDAMGDRIGKLQVARADLDARLRAVEDDRGEFASIAAFREWSSTRIVDLSGKDGSNGKVGAMRARLDAIDKGAETTATRRWAVIMLALGLITSAGGVVAWAVRSVTSLESEVAHLRRDVDRHQQPPARPAQEPAP